MCEKCKDGGNILDGYFENSKGKSFTRLRFDLDNNQFDMQYGICGEDNCPTDEHEWTHSIDISFCPFCGNRLPIAVSVKEFTDFIRSTYIKNGSNVVTGSSIIDGIDLHSTILNNYIINMLTNKYGSPIESVEQAGDVVNIVFKRPEYKHIKGL